MSKPIVNNRKAHRDFFVMESVECGIELKGGEVKSLRDGRMTLDDSFARIDKNEVILYNAHIAQYEQASYLNVESKRPRRLLLHASQIKKLSDKTAQRSFTLVPLKVYFNDRGFAKVELGLCKGKKLYDRREDMKRRETDLEIRRAMKARRK